jgi:hypothetical protein
MVVNNILVLIIDEWNSVCQDNTCYNDIATKKKLVQEIGLLHMPVEDHQWKEVKHQWLLYRE